MSRRRTLRAVVAVAAVLTSAAEAQQQPEQVFRASSELVVLDLVVVDSRGRFVPDLQPQDIEVREDGRRHRVQLLHLVDSGAGGTEGGRITSSSHAAPAAAPADTGGVAGSADAAQRRLAVVIDSIRLSDDAIQRIREALLGALDDLPHGVPVMLATIGPELAVHQPFTNDRRRLADAVASLPPHGQPATGPSTVFDAVDRICAAAVDQRRVLAAAIEAGERLVAEANARSLATSSALTELLSDISGFPGRKHLVFYSAGHAISPLTHAVDAVAAAAAGCTGVDPMRARREASAALGRLATRDAADGLRRVTDRANRAQTTFYTLDPSGITTDAVLPQSRGSSRAGRAAPLATLAQLRNDSGRDYLAGLARETGGLRVTSNDMGAVLKRASEDATQYYLVGYAPAHPGSNEGFRKLAVSVKRRGVDVRYRKGYLASAAVDAKSGSETAGAFAGPRDLPAVVPGSSGSITTPEVPCCPSSSTKEADDNGGAADLLASAARYVDRFVSRFSNVVLEEKLEQALTEAPKQIWGGRSPRFSPGTTVRRRLVSEFLLVRPAGTVFWIPFRDVLEVDGRPVNHAPDRLMRLFAEAGASGTAQADGIAAAGAAHQLGPRSRTTTNPVIALAFLQPHHQFRFRYSVKAPRAARSTPLATLRFRETGKPTLMRTDDGQDLPIHGAFVIDTRTGAVVASELGFQTLGERVVLRTRYAFNARLQVHIPSEMTETHLMRDGGRLETVAHYGRFRTFSVSTSEAFK